MSTLYLIVPILIAIAILVVYVLSTAKRPEVKTKEIDFQVLEIKMPKNESDVKSDSGQSASLAAENMFASLHGLLNEDPDLQEHLSFEIASSKDGIKFYVVAPASILSFVESQLYAQYPQAHISPVTDYVQKKFEDGENYEISSLSLAKESFFPIKTFRDLETESLSSLTSALSQIMQGEHIWLQFLAKPLPDIWQKDGLDYVNSVRNGTVNKPSGLSSILGRIVKAIVNELVLFIYTMVTQPLKGSSTATSYSAKPDNKGTTLPPRLSAMQDLQLKAVENKLSKMGYFAQVRIYSSSTTTERVMNNLRSVAASLKQFSTVNMNAFVSNNVHNKEEVLDLFKKRVMEADNSFILNIEELATIFHLPSSMVETPHISWIYSKKSEPPANLPVSDCCYIGETVYRSNRIKFGIKNDDDRLRHMYLIGKSGTGKSTLFETMISQDIQNGYGVGVLDPHGETIDRVLNYIPDNRIDDVIYFDPSDVEKPIGLNLLELDDPSQKNLMASALVSAIRQHFDYSWGPRLEYLLNYCILTLLEVEGTTLLGVTRLLEDDNYLRYILHQVKDPVVVKFWETEFKNMKGNQKLVTEAIAPIQNKVNRFLASTTIRNILGQRKSTINMWEAMNSGKIVLMNLSKGKIGADNANLLGALVVSRIQFMALQRAKIPYEQRRPFFLYVDEFQNFATGSFEEILSESRKYKLGLYLTHQFTGQLPEELLKAVYGNVGTIAAFSLGAPDARALASEFAPYFNEEDIISLERFNIYIKLMTDGMTSLPFSAKILLPWEENLIAKKYPNNRQAVMDSSRIKYGVDREFIEAKINKWIETKFDKGMAIAQETREKNV